MAGKEAKREADPEVQESSVRAGADKRGYVQYIGLATVKTIRREDWEGAGINGQKEIQFSRANGYRIQRADLSDEAYNIAIRPDQMMILIGGDPAEGSFATHPAMDAPPPAEQQTPMPDPDLYRK
jgi:hypothetical protein